MELIDSGFKFTKGYFDLLEGSVELVQYAG